MKKHRTMLCVCISVALLLSCANTIPSQPAPPELNEAIKRMDAKQREASQQDNQPAVSRMSLRRMFPDAQLRALADAAGRGRLEQIEHLVAQGVDVNTRGTSGATPLYWPIRQGNVAGFKKLLELGADPNVIFDYGSSIMYFVAQETDLEFLRLALEHGADPNLVSGQRERSVDHSEWVFTGHTPLFHAVIFNPNAVEAIDLLLEYGADLGARTIPRRLGNSSCLLMSATVGPKYDVALHLLERGADYNFANENGYGFLAILTRHWTGYPADTPERRKVIADMQKVVDWLTERGVDIPERN